jgi:hypothetical protein
MNILLAHKKNLIVALTTRDLGSGALQIKGGCDDISGKECPRIEM